jgi:hypothetical protein
VVLVMTWPAACFATALLIYLYFCASKASKVSTFAREEVEIEIADELLGDCVMQLPHLDMLFSN